MHKVESELAWVDYRISCHLLVTQRAVVFSDPEDGHM
jgi:hypothetical protein